MIETHQLQAKVYRVEKNKSQLCIVYKKHTLNIKFHVKSKKVEKDIPY